MQNQKIFEKVADNVCHRHLLQRELESSYAMSPLDLQPDAAASAEGNNSGQRCQHRRATGRSTARIRREEFRKESYFLHQQETLGSDCDSNGGRKEGNWRSYCVLGFSHGGQLLGFFKFLA